MAFPKSVFHNQQLANIQNLLSTLNERVDQIPALCDNTPKNSNFGNLSEWASLLSNGTVT